MNIEQPKENQELHYIDKILVLNNGATILARILVDEQYKIDGAIAIFRPMEIVDAITEVYIKKWVVGTSDDVLTIPISKITNISNPDKVFSEAYNKAITVNYIKYQMTVNSDFEEKNTYTKLNNEDITFH